MPGKTKPGKQSNHANEAKVAKEASQAGKAMPAKQRLHEAAANRKIQPTQQSTDTKK